MALLFDVIHLKSEMYIEQIYKNLYVSFCLQTAAGIKAFQIVLSSCGQQLLVESLIMILQCRWIYQHPLLITLNININLYANLNISTGWRMFN